MKNKIRLLAIDRLRDHEAVNKKRLKELVAQLEKVGYIKNPVVVDEKTLVVLDGHHRLAALKKLGINRIPCYLVDYASDEVKVYLRRKELMSTVIKKAVINMGISNRVFPQKTTRHLLKSRPRKVNIRLEALK
jgi:uncharacterized protein (DUF1015 family)